VISNVDANAVALDRLVDGLPQGLLQAGIPPASPIVTGIAYDSRRVRPGDLFVALSGGSTDGHRYIAQAVQAGAVAVAGQQPLENLGVPYLQVQDSRTALAYLSAAFYGFPARRLTVIGVTGTDGKTTTSNLIHQILLAAGLRAGMISTVNAVIGTQTLDTGFHVTTPEAPDVQRYLAMMLAAGLTHVVLESTSHGLAQQRVAACDFDVAVITNITHEHLDYHGTFEAYRAAKARLFASLAETAPKPHRPPRAAVLNRDGLSYDHLRALVTREEIRVISYGQHAQAEVRAAEIEHIPQGLRFVAQGAGWQTPVETHLAGDFNLSNCLAALAAADALGVSPETAAQGIAALPGIPGRMERIDAGQEFLAMVDFAHTPNALRQALLAARKIIEGRSDSGRVIAVFGSAGLRDRAKRRMMAETAVELADLSIFTAEDPRSESLQAILDEMASGARARGGVEGQNFWRIPDRRAALRFAVTQASARDLVIILGKGHEQSMCFGEVEYPWDDRTALRAALAEMLGQSAPTMPYLPAQDG
jgi:UDP-N-acetylmuramoyl-L-alanyl-D-glutamate--2,6-diaminopimelate ligase